MTFEDICKRLEEMGGERVDEGVLKDVDGADVSGLNKMEFDKTACYALAFDRSFHEIKMVAYTACRMIIAFVYDDGYSPDFVLFGVPYLDFNYEQAVRSAIMKKLR